jgi:hypothetical protein
MRKSVPLDAADARALAGWLAEMRELTTALHEAGLDATSKGRVHSRAELRRRQCKLTKRLHWLIDTMQPLLAKSLAPAEASEPSVEEPRLASVA